MVEHPQRRRSHSVYHHPGRCCHHPLSSRPHWYYSLDDAKYDDSIVLVVLVLIVFLVVIPSTSDGSAIQQPIFIPRQGDMDYSIHLRRLPRWSDTVSLPYPYIPTAHSNHSLLYRLPYAKVPKFWHIHQSTSTHNLQYRHDPNSVVPLYNDYMIGSYDAGGTVKILYSLPSEQPKSWYGFLHYWY